MTLTDQLPQTVGPDDLFNAFEAWAKQQGLSLYPHQEEALIEIVSGANVILSTPTGSGESLVAAGAHFAALAQRQRTYYTAPLNAPGRDKACVQFEQISPASEGMMTCDTAENTDPHTN